MRTGFAHPNCQKFGFQNRIFNALSAFVLNVSCEKRKTDDSATAMHAYRSSVKLALAGLDVGTVVADGSNPAQYVVNGFSHGADAESQCIDTLSGDIQLGGGATSACADLQSSSMCMPANATGPQVVKSESGELCRQLASHFSGSTFILPNGNRLGASNATLSIKIVPCGARATDQSGLDTELQHGSA